MVFLLGASGYIGQAFGKEMIQRGIPFRTISRKEINLADHRFLVAALRKEKPKFVINAAGFTGKPNVDACENQRGETITGNVTLAQTVAQACHEVGIMLGFVSSGCIYTGAKVRREPGRWKTCSPNLWCPSYWTSDQTGQRDLPRLTNPTSASPTTTAVFIAGQRLWQRR